MFMIHLHTQLHIPSSNVALAIDFKTKDTCIFRVGAMLFMSNCTKILPWWEFHTFWGSINRGL